MGWIWQRSGVKQGKSPFSTKFNLYFISLCYCSRVYLFHSRMAAVFRKDWSAPDPISEEAIDRVAQLLRTGRLHR